ncbi:SMC-Scp complex subunit ScpB [Pseudogemmatithrix spongiicola]|uniref:SMC-Scp complex subunit ScpB n=1 Tax=Pseudogemmatithrix spongiicola TaxID=3062599 RepID=A0AA49Q8D2_9BACT|nr:SMC-Scp complex subunit ScpB [Gemmatimonadaceae bacterium 'strain 138']WKW14985.1 SMC-Scp complex subunit ScpB [Gemmatimonadaceae bacterium 'strain 318']
MNPLAKLLEAALFASPRPIATDELAALDPEASPAALQSALDELREHYDVDGHGVALVEVGGGWQVLTRPEYTEAIERAQMAVRPTKLSPAALETLAIIAYRQPIGRAEVAEIRGVDVGAVIKSLHERGLIDVVGRAEGLGRPLLYGTTTMFLEQFGLRHLAELPRVDELSIALRKDGQPPVLAADVLEAADAEAAAAVAVDAAADIATAPEGAATA